MLMLATIRGKMSVLRSVSDIQKWTIHNKLKLNEDKSEAQLFDPSKSSDLPDSLKIGQRNIPFWNSARNQGVIDNGLAVKHQVDRICQRDPEGRIVSPVSHQ